MSEPFLAEIRMMGFNFAPRGWAMCDGQILPINQNQTLYSLLGTTYGGDGRTSFALPDIRSRSPIHKGSPSGDGGLSWVLGQRSGEETHTLTTGEMPNHTHKLMGTSAAANTDSPTGARYANTNDTGLKPYGVSSTANQTSLSPYALSSVGGSQPHENMQPYTTLNYCIAIMGLFPSRN